MVIAYLFTKLLWLWDSKETFWSSDYYQTHLVYSQLKNQQDKIADRAHYNYDT